MNKWSRRSIIGLFFLSSLLLGPSATWLSSSGWYCEAQELPNKLYETVPFTGEFNDDFSFRTNVCDRQALFHNDSVSLEDSLRGAQLKVVIVPSQYVQFTDQGAIDPDYPGLEIEILDELASRAGFTWRDSFAVTAGNPNQEYNRSYTDLLTWTTDTYDISIDWWTTTLDRLGLGIRFPESWYDGSIIMVGDVSPNKDDSGISLWGWLAPFDRNVWILIFVSIIVSGIIYFLLESIDQNTDKQRLERSLLENVFVAGLTFTSHFEFKPSTNAGRLFTFSLSFWALIVGAAYTANLASFLVAKNTGNAQVDTVTDAVSYNVPICVLATTAADVAISQEYPNAKNIIRKENEIDTFLALRSGECKYVITTSSAWDYWETQDLVNGDCKLGWVGRTFRFFPAGFATKSDSGTFCTSLIADAIHIHLLRMREEQSIKKAWDKHLLQTSSIRCFEQEAAGSADSNEEGAQLTLQNMGGIFIFHYIISFIAILIALLYKCTGWDQLNAAFEKDGPRSRKAIRKLGYSIRQLLGFDTNDDNIEQQRPEMKLDSRSRLLLEAAEQKTLKDVFGGREDKSLEGQEPCAADNSDNPLVESAENNNFGGVSEHSQRIDALERSLRRLQALANHDHNAQTTRTAEWTIPSETGLELSRRDSNINDTFARTPNLEQQVAILTMQQEYMHQTQTSIHEDLREIRQMLHLRARERSGSL